jgi:hypothetical protein
VAHGLDGSCPDQSINKSTRCIDILVPPRSLIPNFAGLYAHKFPGLSASCPKIPTRRTVSKKGGIAGRHDLGSDEFEEWGKREAKRRKVSKKGGIADRHDLGSDQLRNERRKTRARSDQALGGRPAVGDGRGGIVVKKARLASSPRRLASYPNGDRKGAAIKKDALLPDSAKPETHDSLSNLGHILL